MAVCHVDGVMSALPQPVYQAEAPRPRTATQRELGLALAVIGAFIATCWLFTWLVLALLPREYMPMFAPGIPVRVKPRYWSGIESGLSKIRVESLLGKPTSKYRDDLWFYEDSDEYGSVMFDKERVYLWRNAERLEAGE